MSLMLKIKYTETDQRGLDLIADLWRKLNEHHQVRSPYHAGHYAKMNFGIRKKQLLGKSQKGALHIDLAEDVKTGKLVGYCVSTISAVKQGEIDSIYIEEDYRRCRIGDNLMKKALKWMDNLGIAEKIIAVAVGNEEAFAFYSRYNFYPRVTYLRQIEKD